MKTRLLVLFACLLPVWVQAQALSRSHEALHTVLYAQTAGEFEAGAMQVYAQARQQLDQALADPAWTAALEQTGSFGSLPPAVILDLDETVLDNSLYNAYLVDRNKSAEHEDWVQWINARKAEPIPGSLEFVQYAVSKGVRVFYVTNRNVTEESGTLANLQALGYPVDADGANLMSGGEMPDWTGDKTSRRQSIAQTHRILLLVGDDLNDFFTGSRTGVAARNALAKSYQDFWGVKWFLLPADTHGGWERALYDFTGSPSREDLLRIKYQSLRYEPAFCSSDPIDWTQLKTHEMLNSLVWRQSAGESFAVSWQVYAFARRQLDRMVANSSETAALEQTDPAETLPPAIVTDIDETIFDNSTALASLTINRTVSLVDLLPDWFVMKKAEPIPGSVEFLQYAASKGVRVFYVTNRPYPFESGTLANLQVLGYPVDADGANLLTSAEMADWGSDKTTRRRFLAQDYRILLLFGDDLNDFFTGSFAGVAARNALTAQYGPFWGDRWFILPNSQYGGWEGALHDFVGSPTRDELIRIKFNSLILPESLFPSSVDTYDLYR